MGAITGGIIAGVGAAAGGYMSSEASKDAAAAQAGAARDAAGLQYQQYRQTREDLAPYRQIGTQSLRSLADLYGQGPGDYEQAMRSFETSPGYQFRLDQGQQAIERSAAASGRLDSGATMQDLTRFGQGIASEEFGNYANRLASLAGVGQTAVNQTGQFGAQAATNQGNALMQAGQARASGYMGSANAINQGIGNLAGIYGMYQSGGFGGGGGYQVPSDITANQNAINQWF